MAHLDSTAQTEPAETLVFCLSSQGHELRGTVVHLARYSVVFEVYSPAIVLRSSEVLSEFRIVSGERTLYSGRAVITSLVTTGAVIVCEGTLDDSWQDADLRALTQSLEGKLAPEFTSFLQQWQRIYKVRPEFKTAVADMQTFLTDLRLWLEQIEVGIRSAPAGDRLRLERDVAGELGPATSKALTSLFENFENSLQGIEPELQPIHRTFCRRQLHPLLLSSPFLYRTFAKPLGYAGDYEMVNMICRDPLEGSNLFAKLLNLWFLLQPPAAAHRNRLQFLYDRIVEVAARAARENRIARIVNVGCGPCAEIQKFIVESELASRTDFLLIDFNEETIQHTRSLLEDLKSRHGRTTGIELVKKSVNQILKEAGRTVQRKRETQFDFVYCAGLFDYLSDQICRRLSSIMYEWTAPGGLFLTTNVDAYNPRRLTMDYIMDWHLIYRSAAELAALKPDRAPAAGAVTADMTGVNIHYTVTKPLDE
jgi:extracellular factor (EF) 3-hydroxypalmitic acid methyl ester biosynthesis protein